MASRLVEKARARASSATTQAADVRKPPDVASLICEATLGPSVFKDGAFDAALLKWRRLSETLLESTLETEDDKREELHGDAWNKLGALFASAWPRAISEGWSLMVEGMEKADPDDDVETVPRETTRKLHADVSAWRDAASIVFDMPTRAGGPLHNSAIRDLVAGACGKQCEARMELAANLANVVDGIASLAQQWNVASNAGLTRFAKAARKALNDAQVLDKDPIEKYLKIAEDIVAETISELEADAKKQFQSSVIETDAVFLPGDVSDLQMPTRDAGADMNDYIDIMTIFMTFSEGRAWKCVEQYSTQWQGKLHATRVAGRNFFKAAWAIGEGDVAQFVDGLDAATKALVDNNKGAMAWAEKSSEKFLRIDAHLLQHRDQLASHIVEMDDY